MGEACSTNGSDEKYIKMLVGLSKKKRLIVRPKRRCENNIRIELKEIVSEGVD
jgi:hypothetical protein